MDIITFVTQNLSTITTAVQLVEVLFGGGQGEQKKQVVVDTLTSLAKKAGLNIDANLVGVIVEIFVAFLKITKKI